MLTELSDGLPNNVFFLDLSENKLNELEAANLPSELEVLKVDQNPFNCKRLKSKNVLNEHLKKTCDSRRKPGLLIILAFIAGIFLVIAGTEIK